MSIQIVAVTRSNKGKGVTVTLSRDGATKDFVMRKTGGEKYGKIVLYTLPDEQYAQAWPDRDPMWPVTFSIHKPTTRPSRGFIPKSWIETQMVEF